MHFPLPCIPIHIFNLTKKEYIINSHLSSKHFAICHAIKPNKIEIYLLLKKSVLSKYILFLPVHQVQRIPYFQFPQQREH